MEQASVIEVNFGKEERETVQKFARLMGIVEAHERDIIKNPIKHLDRVGKEICRLQNGIREAIEATYPSVRPYDLAIPHRFEMEMDIIRVDRQEYERMKKALAIIEALNAPSWPKPTA